MSDGSRYKDKVTIVTGGSRGIGLGIVEVFVRAGAKVVIASNEVETANNKDLRSTCTPLKYWAIWNLSELLNANKVATAKNKDLGSTCTPLKPDLGLFEICLNYGMLTRWRQPKNKDLGSTCTPLKPDLGLLEICRNYGIISRYCLPHLRKTKGNIIQTASIGTHCGQSGASPYCATKGAISTFTKSLAVDEAGNGVRVNAFSPSCICTLLVLDLAHKSGNAEKMLKEAGDIHLLGRMGTPEEMGKVCLFLAADATFCTGLDLMATGGAELGYGPKNPLVKEPGSFF